MIDPHLFSVVRQELLKNQRLIADTLREEDAHDQARHWDELARRVARAAQGALKRDDGQEGGSQ
jgi:hypothetical protein